MGKLSKPIKIMDYDQFALNPNYNLDDRILKTSRTKSLGLVRNLIRLEKEINLTYSPVFRGIDGINNPNLIKLMRQKINKIFDKIFPYKSRHSI